MDSPQLGSGETKTETEKQMTQIKLQSEIPVRLIQKVGGDHMFVAAARVSTQGTEALKYADPECAEGNVGLINYLMSQRHGSVFEHGSLTFFVHAPILVWREHHRHRVFSYNEESGRYKQLEPVFYVPERERLMMKVEGWKPGRPKFLRCEDDGVYEQLCRNLENSYRCAYETYEQNLALGVDPGLARDCLPVGIYSGCWVTCNPRALMHFLSLRTYEPDNAKFVSYPLHEIEVVARQYEAIFAQEFPITYKVFCDNGRVAP